MSSRLQKNSRYCGTCQHYNWTIGPHRKTTCNNLGCIETTPSCIDYSINPFVLQDFEKVLVPLADVLRVMPVTTLSLFYEVISQEKSLRRKGYTFLEKVAIKYWGTPSQQYVSNYILANVYSATNDGVFVIAKSGTRMFVLKESVIKLEHFLELRRDLKNKDLIVDPTLSSRASAKQKLAVTETLDDIISRGFVDDEDLDTEIKRRLNPKRINAELLKSMDLESVSKTSKRIHVEEDCTPAEITMSTKKKVKKNSIVDEKRIEIPHLFPELGKKKNKNPQTKKTPFQLMMKRRGVK